MGIINVQALLGNYQSGKGYALSLFTDKEQASIAISDRAGMDAIYSTGPLLSARMQFHKLELIAIVESCGYGEQITQYINRMFSYSYTTFNQVAANATAMTAIINNASALATVVASATAMTAIINNASALATVVASATAMTAIAASATAMTAIFNSPTAVAAVNKSQIATDAIAKATDPVITQTVVNLAGLPQGVYTSMTAIINNASALATVVASATAMTAIAASATAMTAIINNASALATVVASATAMTAIAGNSTAIRAVIRSSTAKTELIKQNTILQSLALKWWETVKTGFRIVREQKDNDGVTDANLANAEYIMFAIPGGFSGGSGVTNCFHGHNTIAAGSGSGSYSDTTKIRVLLGGGTFTETGDGMVRTWVYGI